MYKHTSIKLNQLAKCIERQKISHQDQKFLKSYLTTDHYKQLEALLKEKKIKPSKEVKPIAREKSLPMCMTILNEPRFAAEFAVHYASTHKSSRVAVLDADRLNPMLDVYLNASSHIKTIYSHLSFNRATGLNLLVDALNKHTLNKQFTDHMAIRIDGYKNLYFFSGSYLIEDYEYFRIEDYKRLIDYLKQAYDVVLIHTNGFIYDGFTCYSLILSHLNIIPLKGRYADVIGTKKSIDFITNKQSISNDKWCYMMFDHHRQDMSDEMFDQMVSQKTLRTIPYHTNRNDACIGGYSPTLYKGRIHSKDYQKLFKDIQKKIRKLYEFN